MKKELEKWRQFLTEKERIVQDMYEATFLLALEQSKEIDRTEVMGFIRAIENVTTVYREREVSTSRKTFVGEYTIRFVLPHGADVKYYFDTVLKPSLRRIKGLAIQRDMGYEKIGDE
tara:strand:- start:43 stop:393 length:351 start_codon:yes stop_codon:yes gene_type:complete